MTIGLSRGTLGGVTTIIAAAGRGRDQAADLKDGGEGFHCTLESGHRNVNMIRIRSVSFVSENPKPRHLVQTSE